MVPCTSISVNLPETGFRPPGRNRWWRSSNPPRGPAILHTARQRSGFIYVNSREQVDILSSEIKTVTSAESDRLTHKDEVSEAELHGAEHAQDDGHYVQEVGQYGSPLVPQKIKHLPLQGGHLGDGSHAHVITRYIQAYKSSEACR